jgi:hypothetical protein
VGKPKVTPAERSVDGCIANFVRGARDVTIDLTSLRRLQLRPAYRRTLHALADLMVRRSEVGDEAYTVQASAIGRTACWLTQALNTEWSGYGDSPTIVFMGQLRQTDPDQVDIAGEALLQLVERYAAEDNATAYREEAS